MRWLIDGYNVVRRDPELRGAEEAGLEEGRRALVRLVAGRARHSSDQFLVVFDGARRVGADTTSPAPGQVQVIFSRPPQTADDVLGHMARQWREGAVVVTSDRTVRDGARRAGCAVVGADEFVAALTRRDDSGADDDDDDDDQRSSDKRGNPRRLSREARAARRALRRLSEG